MITAFICAASIVALVLADQLVKYAVISNMAFGETIDFINGFMQWTYITNEGASWGMFGGQTFLLVAITIIIIAGLTWFFAVEKDVHWLGYFSYILVISGGIGNLLDRVFNGGKVIDYIDITPLFDFPIFNLADCFVVCGGILLCVYVIFLQKNDKKDVSKNKA